jgi:hypothetical protein
MKEAEIKKIVRERYGATARAAACECAPAAGSSC